MVTWVLGSGGGGWTLPSDFSMPGLPLPPLLCLTVSLWIAAYPISILFLVALFSRYASIYLFPLDLLTLLKTKSGTWPVLVFSLLLSMYLPSCFHSLFLSSY